VEDTIDLDRGDRGTRDRAQQGAAQRVAQGVAEARLQRLDDEAAVDLAGVGLDAWT
jgi:hypothetical protein